MWCVWCECVCSVCVCVNVSVCNSCLISAEVRGSFEGVFSLLPPRGFWGSDSGLRRGSKHPFLLGHLTGSPAGLELAVWPRIMLDS